VIDSAESVEAVTQDALHFSLIEMKTRVIRLIDDALERAGHDDFGCCAVCGDEISSRRLKALPFAIRCTPCESDAETAQESARTAATRLRRSTFEFS
jgi:DnaK suppressor protein